MRDPDWKPNNDPQFDMTVSIDHVFGSQNSVGAH